MGRLLLDLESDVVPQLIRAVLHGLTELNDRSADHLELEQHRLEQICNPLKLSGSLLRGIGRQCNRNRPDGIAPGRERRVEGKCPAAELRDAIEAAVDAHGVSSTPKALKDTLPLALRTRMTSVASSVMPIVNPLVSFACKGESKETYCLGASTAPPCATEMR